jgi:hypothetical protein
MAKLTISKINMTKLEMIEPTMNKIDMAKLNKE